MILFMVNKRVLSVLRGRWLVLIMLSWLAGGCSNTPMKFYMLSTGTQQAANPDGLAFDPHLLLGLGPIHVPDYLDRPQLIVEVAKNQYQLDEHHRWAERLDQNIRRVLAQFLVAQLGVEQVVHYPWSQRQAPDYQINLDILELHQSADGYSRLQAQWQIKHQEQTVLGKHFSCSLAAGADVEAIVNAQSNCLGQLAVEIASGLRQVVNTGGLKP